MKIKVISTLMFILGVVCYGQNVNYTFGEPDVKYLKLESYAPEPDAGALIIYERGESVIKRNKFDHTRIFYTYKVRIKIFNKSEFGKATFTIPLYKSSNGSVEQYLVSVRGRSYNIDSPLGMISTNDVYYEDYSKTVKLAKFTLPKVKEGTLFDVEYTTESPFFYSFPSWDFQSDIPKLYSEYYTKIPANYLYNMHMVGPYKAEVDSKIEPKCLDGGSGAYADCQVNTFTMKNIPSFIAEDYMTSKENYLSKIKYELRETQNFSGIKDKITKTWKDVDHEFKTMDIGKQSRKSGAFKKLIPEDIANKPNSIDKAKEIYYYVQSKMLWDGKRNIFSNDLNVKEAFEEGKGGVADLNLALLNMLNAADFDAYMVLIRERSDGFPTLLYPVLTEFNYVIVKLVIDDKVFYLDVTEKYMPFGLLPLRALNNYGRVFNFKEESQWDNIFMNSLSTLNTFVQYSLDEEGILQMKKSEKSTGLFSLSRRERINEQNESSYLTKLENKFSKDNNAEIISYKSYNAEDLEKTLMENYEMEFEDPFVENQLFFNPFSADLNTKNPFKLKERSYPVDFGYPKAHFLKLVFKVPDNYEVTLLPEATSYEYENLLKLDFKVFKEGNTVSFDLSYYIYKSVFMPEEYDKVKEMFSKLVTIGNANLVLTRKQ